MLVVVKLVMTALMIYACVLQLNDHDGAFWIILYGLVAVVTVVSLFRPVRRGALWLFLVYLVATVVIAIGVDRWHVDSERAREALGIAICTTWLGLLGRGWGGRLRGRI